MGKYYVLSESQVERLAETIKAAILKGVKPLNLPDDEPGGSRTVRRATARGTGGRKRLSQVVYENMGQEPFTTKEAFDKIRGQYEFKGARGLDSIRTSLASDSRFERLDDGRFKKR